MSFGPILALVLAAASIATLFAPPAATAKPGYVVIPAQRLGSLELGGTRGFRIGIAQEGGRVELTASGGETAAIYIVRRRGLPLGRIEARFPGVGRVSLRFVPSGKPQREPPFCKGRAAIKQPGTFRGLIRFRGERGFTRATATRAKGYVYRSFKEVCKRSEVESGTETPGYSLAALSRSRSGRVVSFSAFRSTEESVLYGETYYWATVLEMRRRMRIARIATAEGAPITFAVEGPPERPDVASVAPPPPLSGSARFRAQPGVPPEWQGSLAVDLPGAGTVSLTGPSFASNLCLNRRCAVPVSRSGDDSATATLPRSEGLGGAADFGALKRPLAEGRASLKKTIQRRRLRDAQ